jgi:hypothetical protein
MAKRKHTYERAKRKRTALRRVKAAAKLEMSQAEDMSATPAAPGKATKA